MSWIGNTDIFGRLDWLTKKIKNLLGRVYTLEQNTIKPGLDTTSNGTKLTVNFDSVGPKVTFTKVDGGSEIDVIIPGELEITRGNNGGIYNSAYEEGSSNTSPSYTEWNSIYTDTANHGWYNLTAAADRTYDTFRSSCNSEIGMRVVGMEMLMRHTTTGRIWMIKFTDWTNGINEIGQGGGFSYERYEILVPVIVTRADDEDTFADVIEPGKTIIKRDSYPSGYPTCIGGGIYNSAVETFYNRCTYTPPANTEWNSEYIDATFGFNDLSNVQTRKYGTWNDALSGNVGNNILSTELVMHDLSTDLYWKFQFTDWTPGSNGGGMSYIRTLIPTDQGIRFPDGTFINTASTSSNSSTVDSEGNLIGIDNSANTVNVDPGGTHDIPNFSGMFIVNDHYDGGVEVWLCGGGPDAVLINRTNFGPGEGEVTINGAINGYTWTNSHNQVGPFTFTVIKTRSGA